MSLMVTIEFREAQKLTEQIERSREKASEQLRLDRDHLKSK